MSKKLIFTLTLATTLASSAVLANKVKFNRGDTDGTFHCVTNTIIDRFKKVDIHTDGVEVNGFCAGQEYVQRPGHITGMTMSELSKYYFEYKKTIGKEGSVDVVASNEDDVSCYVGKGDNTEHRKAYGNGKYC
jgi:hypothetical protein